jgi:putative CocE/NonD family hydrolase
MRDGVTLAADVYTPSDGPAPVLLMRTPYGKSTFAENAWAGVDPVAAARSGFIVVIQDTRGRFASDGEWAPLTHDALDGYDTVEWAARLPGANGHVGMFGGSYSGNTQWQAALAGPPSLTAIAPLMTWADPLDGLYARGGAAELGLALPWTLMTGADDVARRHPAEAMSRIDAIIDELDDLGAEGFWRQAPGHARMIERHDVRELGTLRVAADGSRPGDPADISGRQPHCAVPAFHTGGWFDLFLQGTIDNYQAMVAHGLDARLVVGPWSHADFGDAVGEMTFGMRASRDSHAVHPAGTWVQAQLSWLRAQLEPGTGPSDPIDDPPVRIFVMGRNEWRSERSWPPADAAQSRWFLHAGGVLSPASPDTGTTPSAYDYDLTNPVPTVGGNTYITSAVPSGPMDQRVIESRTDVLTFTSEVLAEDVEVTGRVTAHLHAGSSARCTDWVVRLCDVHPDGRSINVCDGVLRVRQGADPGPYVIDLWSTSIVFLAGHRIRVDVANSSFPRWDRPPAGDGYTTEQAHVGVDGDQPSWIVLPTRPPASGDR